MVIKIDRNITCRIRAHFPVKQVLDKLGKYGIIV